MPWRSVPASAAVPAKRAGEPYDVGMPDARNPRVRLDPTTPPAEVIGDPEKYRAWRRLWVRILVRWWVLAAATLAPLAIVTVLAFRWQVIPVSAVVPITVTIVVISVAAMILVRRRALRDMAEYAERELSEPV
jgi:hypothetical protein